MRIQIDDTTRASLHPRRAPQPWDRRRPLTKTRIYVSGNAVVPAWEQPPITRKGDDPANDAAWRAYNREELRLMRLAMKRTLAALGHEDVTTRFSRTAGCSCGCSAGFLADRVLTQDGFGQIEDLFIDAEVAE